MMINNGKIFFPAVVALILVISGPARAWSQDTFKGQTIRFIVGYSPGGTFDAYTRTIARHFAKNVPGNPAIIVENMTGAAGIIAANHVYNRVKPDGLTIGAWATPLVLQHIMGNEAVQFDGRKFGYLGVPSPYETVCVFNEKSGIAKMEDWVTSKRPQKIAGIGPGTAPSDVPKLLQAGLGLPMEVLDGYKGGADARLALESGEVDGYCGSWTNVETSWKSQYESGKIRAVLQATLKSNPKYEHVPLAIKYAKSEEARDLLKIADNAHGAQFPYSVPPGTPKDRLEILQKAFVQTLKDKEFLAEATKAKLDIDVIDGPMFTKTVASLYEAKPATVAKLKEVLVPKKR